MGREFDDPEGRRYFNLSAQLVSEIGRDYDAIRAKWPYFGDYPWFGAAE